MFVVSITYIRDLSDVDEQLGAHITFLEKYYSLGKFIVSGRKVPRTGGVILVNASNRDEIDTILDEDPFNISGLATYEITEFVPTMTGTGFEALKNLN